MTPDIREAMLSGELALLNTPWSNYQLDLLPGVTWAADNGCFSARWKEERWWNWLERNAEHIDRCLFAAVPDVVGNHEQTLQLWWHWSPRMRELGYPLAFVLQDGCESADQVPWDYLDWVFVGGTTDYKLSPAVEMLLQEARLRGKRRHMGRVNSKRRILLASRWGCETVDGTFLAFGPDVNLPRLRRYLAAADAETLF